LTISLLSLALYGLAIFGLFITPGPVWVALIARALSGGFAAAWPVALAVVLGDLFWALLAIFGIAWISTVYEPFLAVLRWVASGIFILMGVLVIRHAATTISADSRLTRPGVWAGFVAGLAVILGNPKAVLFYMGVLPGFFDLSIIRWPDIVAILLVSTTVPLAGNLALAALVGRVRAFLASPEKRIRLNRISGALLIGVGCALPFV